MRNIYSCPIHLPSMLVMMNNYAKHYANTIYQSVFARKEPDQKLPKSIKSWIVLWLRSLIYYLLKATSNLYLYFDFSGEQPSTKRLQGSRFPSLFTNNLMIYTPKRNACVGGGGGGGRGVPMRYYPLPETHLGSCFSLKATLTPEAAEVAPFCPFFAMIEKKPSSRQKSRRIPWELGYSVVYSLCT